MTSANDEFLAELDEFLDACDVSVFSAMSSLVDGDALSRIESNDGVQQSVEGDKHEEAAVALSAQRKLIRAEKDRKRRRLYHERQKLERETLKKQIQQLSVLLEGAHQRKQKAAEHESGSESLLSKTWELIAKRQMVARQAAEEQHRRLCAAVKSKADLIQELDSVLNEQLGRLSLASDQQHACTQHKSIDAEIYAAYIQELQRMYVKTDDIFRQGGHLNVEAVWRRKGRTGGYFEYGDKRLLPFGFQQTCETLWQASHMLHRQELRQHYDAIEDPENTIAVKFRITSLPKSGRTRSVMYHAVSRRYEEKNRVVIVWRSFTEGEGFFTGMNLDESGWCVLKPSQAGTEIELCIRDVPMHVATATDESTVEQFTGFVFSSNSENYREIARILEAMHLVAQDRVS